jgi:hypothetical protein
MVSKVIFLKFDAWCISRGKKKNWKPDVLVERYRWLLKVRKSVYFNQIYPCSIQKIGLCLKNKIDILHFHYLYSFINTRIIHLFFRSSSNPNTSKKKEKKKLNLFSQPSLYELKISWKVNQKRTLLFCWKAEIVHVTIR